MVTGEKGPGYVVTLITVRMEEVNTGEEEIMIGECLTKEEAAAVWELTRDIDNPLHPWVEVYKVKDILPDKFSDLF